jgi:hypothetical protein
VQLSNIQEHESDKVLGIVHDHLVIIHMPAELESGVGLQEAAGGEGDLKYFPEEHRVGEGQACDTYQGSVKGVMRSA